MMQVQQHQEGFDVEKCQSQLDAWQKRLVEEERLFPQMQTVVTRNGECVYSNSTGERREGVPIGSDSIFRIYSMTKPIVCVALMQLVEQGKVSLDDPVSKFIPAFENMTVLVQPNENDEKTVTVDNYETVPATQTMTVQHLLSHTSGISYGFDVEGELVLLDGIYNKSPILKGIGPFGIFGHSCTLETFCNELAKQPLLFEPGTAWLYGRSHDVIGRIIEVVSGMTLGDYLEKNIFKPLDMVDTSFVVPEEKMDRFAAGYFAPGEGAPNQDISSVYPNMYDASDEASTMQDGGGGLVSTEDDYIKFCQCLLNEGVVDKETGARIIESDTLKLMTQNHLPDGKCLTDAVADTAFSWIAKTEPGDSRSSYGLGFATTMDKYMWDGETLGVSVGTFCWVGAAKTIMWIDPVEKICVVSMTNLINAEHYRKELVEIVYGCLAERAK